MLLTEKSLWYAVHVFRAAITEQYAGSHHFDIATAKGAYFVLVHLSTSEIGYTMEVVQ
jgi:hypothetical protein